MTNVSLQSSACPSSKSLMGWPTGAGPALADSLRWDLGAIAFQETILALQKNAKTPFKSRIPTVAL